MALTKEILNSHPATTLKKEIAKTNLKGYSKMKKSELVDLMMKNKEKFGHIRKKGEASAPEPRTLKKGFGIRRLPTTSKSSDRLLKEIRKQVEIDNANPKPKGQFAWQNDKYSYGDLEENDFILAMFNAIYNNESKFKIDKSTSEKDTRYKTTEYKLYRAMTKIFTKWQGGLPTGFNSLGPGTKRYKDDYKSIFKIKRFGKDKFISNRGEDVLVMESLSNENWNKLKQIFIENFKAVPPPAKGQKKLSAEEFWNLINQQSIKPEHGEIFENYRNSTPLDAGGKK